MAKKKQNQAKTIEISSSPDTRVESWAVREYRNMLRKLGKDIYATLAPVIKESNAQGKIDGINEMLDAFKSLKFHVVGGDAFARGFAERNMDSGNRKFQQEANQALGIDLIDTMPSSAPLAFKPVTEASASKIVTWESFDSGYARAWQYRNSDYWEEIQKDYIARVTGAVNDNFFAGYHLKNLTEEIRSIGKLSLTDAKRIARTENSKLQSLANQSRMIKSGVTESIWKTVGDNRVRDKGSKSSGCNHRLLNNVRFDPKVGIPVTGGFLLGAGLGRGNVRPCAVINCRCTVVAYFDLSNLVQMNT